MEWVHGEVDREAEQTLVRQCIIDARRIGHCRALEITGEGQRR
jgi:hypothetical protein